MENKIQVEEYIRTYNGIIGRILEDEDIAENGVYIDTTFFDDYADVTNFVKYENIAKHSKIESEIVEIGDYVNGKLIIKIDKGENYCYLYYDNKKAFVNYQMLSIVTKEQFKNVEYKI